jgi:hypothetical protein
MANKKPNWTSWVLRFVGSLAYLAVVWSLWQSTAVVGVAGNVFAPVLFGIAVVAAVSLFLVTLAGIGAPSDPSREWSGKATMLGGFALFALLPLVAGAWTTWSWVALVGFVLAYIGIWMDR